jgi:alpha-D-ribose 1-methylphosphonate 5-triphosphate synthase subunit PhnH
MSVLLPGFADPVLDAQRAFRAVLEAMSRPGTLHPAGGELRAPSPLAPATAAVLLTLADADTPVWLAAPFAEARDWIAFHCGATIVPRAADAAFAVAPEMIDLAALNTGSDEIPEDGATLILQLGAFDRGKKLRLAGPGLATPVTLAVDGVGEKFLAAWEANHALYPRGVDLILCAGETLAAFPRSLRITEG